MRKFLVSGQFFSMQTCFPTLALEFWLLIRGYKCSLWEKFSSYFRSTLRKKWYFPSAWWRKPCDQALTTRFVALKSSKWIAVKPGRHHCNAYLKTFTFLILINGFFVNLTCVSHFTFRLRKVLCENLFNEKYTFK